MNIDDLKSGPRVRVMVGSDNLVAVIRYTLLTLENDHVKIKKECLNRLGEWVPAGEGAPYLWNEFEVVRLAKMSDWQLLYPDSDSS